MKMFELNENLQVRKEFSLYSSHRRFVAKQKMKDRKIKFVIEKNKLKICFFLNYANFLH